MFNILKKGNNNREEYIAQREIYLKDIRETSKTFDNIMITLSSGLLGTVLIFIPKITKDYKENIDIHLFFYLGFFFTFLFISIVSILISYKIAYKNSNFGLKREDKEYKLKVLKKSKKECEANISKVKLEIKLINLDIGKNDKIINLLNKISLHSFVYGLLSIIIFYFLILYSYVK